MEGVHDERLTVELTDGWSITVSLAWYPRLFFVTAKQRQNWKLAGGGYGIHWPDIDEDLSTEGVLRGAPAPRGSATSTKPRSRAKQAPRTRVD